MQAVRLLPCLSWMLLPVAGVVMFPRLILALALLQANHLAVRRQPVHAACTVVQPPVSTARYPKATDKTAPCRGHQAELLVVASLWAWRPPQVVPLALLLWGQTRTGPAHPQVLDCLCGVPCLGLSHSFALPQGPSTLMQITHIGWPRLLDTGGGCVLPENGTGLAEPYPCDQPIIVVRKVTYEQP